MEALVFHGIRQLSLEDLPIPEPAADEVLVQVRACGICGSDLHGYLGHSPRRTAHIPLVMGHEISGRIVGLGEGDVGDLVVGQRVVIQPQISCGRCRACRAGMANICPNMRILGIEQDGGFADYVRVPANRIFPIPDQINDVTASVTETLAVEVHLFRRFAPLYPPTVVVLGAGAQGLLAVQLARNAGAGQIIVSDILDHRLELAVLSGATETVRADRDSPVAHVLAATEDWGADFVIDAVGSPITRQHGLEMLAPGGTLALVGLGKGETIVNFLPVVNKELNIHGSYCYSDDDFRLALDMLIANQIQPKDMLQQAPLREGSAYFDQLVMQPDTVTKVILVTE